MQNENENEIRDFWDDDEFYFTQKYEKMNEEEKQKHLKHLEEIQQKKEEYKKSNRIH
jgi:hypothetical protein